MAVSLLRRRVGHSLIGAAFAALFLTATIPAASAQQVVVIVNGDPITALDIEQRSKLVEASNHKVPTRQEVIDELINERLQIKEGKKFGLEASDTEVENAYAGMANRMRISAEQFGEVLGKSGIKPPTLKAKLRAQIVWTQLVKGRFQSTLQIGEKEILSAVDAKADPKDSIAYEYSLRPILFIVSKGSAETSFEARKREAEALRGRFESCDEGVRVARLLKDVAVREPIIRSSADLAEQLRGILEGTAVGHLTPPEVTKQGVEMFAVCNKKQTTSDTPKLRAAKEKIFTSRYEQQAKRYMDEVRRGAMIEYR